MKVIAIEDFSGGKNTFDLQSQIADNECASGTSNVWAPQKALTKIGGMTINTSMTSTGSTLASFYVDESSDLGFTFFARVGSGAQTGYFPWLNGVTPLGYITGTCALTGRSATGSGTLWASQASAGDMFRINGTASAWKNISSVEDNTHLTLAASLPGNAGAGSAYVIMPGIDRVEIPWASLASGWNSCSTANLMQRYDGNGILRFSSAPAAAFLSVFKNYMFAARTNTANSRLYWSTIKDPTSWPANNFIDIDKDFGRITGMKDYGNELIIFKTRRMYKVVGDTFDPSNPTYAVYPIGVPPNFFFNSNFSATVHNGLLYFAAQDGIYVYRQGTFRIEKISKKMVIDWATSFTTPDSIAGASQRIYGFSYNNYLIFKGLAYFNGTRTSAILIDDKGAYWLCRDTDTSTSETVFDITPCGVQGSLSVPPILLTGTPTTPHILQWDLWGPPPGYLTNFIIPSSGVNQVINATWLSKEFNIEYGTFKHCVVYLEKQPAGNLTFAWSIDQAAFVSNTIDMTLGRGQIIRSTLNINQKGSTIQLRITQAVMSQTFQVHAIKIFYEPYVEDRKL